MSRRCGALTLTGTNCKQILQENQERCWQHRGPQCAVCLASMGGQRETRTIGCGHEFHTACLNRWKTSCTGPDPTCPMCRVPFDVPTYRCRLMIERVQDGQRSMLPFDASNIHNIIEGFGLDMRQLIPPGPGRYITDLHFDIEDDEDIGEVLRQLGLPVPVIPSLREPTSNTIG